MLKLGKHKQCWQQCFFIFLLIICVVLVRCVFLYVCFSVLCFCSVLVRFIRCVCFISCACGVRVAGLCRCTYVVVSRALYTYIFIIL